MSMIAGVSGVMSAMARFDRAAQQTVVNASTGKDFVSDFVEQIEARTAFDASVSVIKTSAEMTGRLLDLKA